MMKYSEILTLAKAEFKDEFNWNKDGWFFKGTYVLTPGIENIKNVNCMCGIGATIKVAYEDFSGEDSLTGLNYEFDDFINWVDDKVSRITSISYTNFYAFNDDPNTTFEGLLEMFDNLIEIAKTEGV